MTAPPVAPESRGDDGEDLDTALAGVAAVTRLIVCCDYDGTLAPIVADPAAAAPEPGAAEALAELAALPDTVVALVSGRSLSVLGDLSGAPAGVRLVGSHGIEHDAPVVLTEQEASRLDRLRAAVADVVTGVPGVRLEDKPAGLAVHVRQADPEVGTDVLARVAALADRAGVHATAGKMVVELSVRPPGKGASVERLRREAGAAAVVFLGDDETDESAFAVLRVSDVGVKVGTGETVAVHRVATPTDAVRVLRRLHALRALAVGG